MSRWKRMRVFSGLSNAIRRGFDAGFREFVETWQEKQSNRTVEGFAKSAPVCRIHLEGVTLSREILPAGTESPTTHELTVLEGVGVVEVYDREWRLQDIYSGPMQVGVAGVPADAVEVNSAHFVLENGVVRETLLRTAGLGDLRLLDEALRAQ